jgi:acetoin utilization protein AcuB
MKHLGWESNDREEEREEGRELTMKKIPPIESVMTPFALSIEIDDLVRTAEDMMIDHEIRHLAVTDSGTLVGVVSDRDIAFTANTAEPDLRNRLHVRDVCSLDVYSVERNERLDCVLAEMAERHIGSAIVTDGGKIAGVFTATDACRCFAEFLRSR